VHARRASGGGDTTGSGREQRSTILVDGEETGGRFALVETVEVWGGGLPRHRHHWEDEALYVLEGELAVCLGDERIAASAGTVVLLPRGVEHAVAAVTQEARALAVFTPAGFEGFYRELGEAAPDLERLVAMAARFGCEITGRAPVPGVDKPSRAEAAARAAVVGRVEASWAPGSPGWIDRMDT